jgi:hypothetical protein
MPLFCRHQGFRQIHVVVRKVDEEGLDADDSPFLKLSLEEAIQAVRDPLEGGETIPEETGEPEGSEQ